MICHFFVSQSNNCCFQYTTLRTIRTEFLKTFPTGVAKVIYSDTTGVEVEVILKNGKRRWCYFMTPEILKEVGDWVPGTEVRVHYGVPHMIVVSELTESIVEKVLNQIEADGQLELCTRAVDDPAA